MIGSENHHISFQGKPIGETVTRRTEVFICRSCGYAICWAGFCSYGCGNDDTLLRDRSNNSVIVRVWERTDKLIEERDYEGREAAGE